MRVSESNLNDKFDIFSRNKEFNASKNAIIDAKIILMNQSKNNAIIKNWNQIFKYIIRNWCNTNYFNDDT